MFFAVYTVYRTGLSFQSLQTCLLTTEILSGTILVILQSHTHGHFCWPTFLRAHRFLLYTTRHASRTKNLQRMS